jgi:predicted transcriptional regulator
MATAKAEALALIGKLPDEASWDDIMYELYVKQKIETGLQAAADGTTVPHEEIKDRLKRRRQLAS